LDEIFELVKKYSWLHALPDLLESDALKSRPRDERRAKIIFALWRIFGRPVRSDALEKLAGRSYNTMRDWPRKSWWDELIAYIQQADDESIAGMVMLARQKHRQVLETGQGHVLMRGIELAYDQDKRRRQDEVGEENITDDWWTASEG
jgi:hypothetical protein